MKRRVTGVSSHLTSSGSILILFVIFILPRDVSSYCWQVGWNPSFTEAPKITQIDLAHVRVSWEGIAKNRECADQFLVKYWKVRGVVMTKNGREKGWLEGFRLSNQVDNTVDFMDIEVTPKALYKFQAIAREDKGAVGGVEYNKSPEVLFNTSSTDNVRVSLIPGVTNEILLIVTIASLFGTIVVVGIIYKISGYKPKITIVEDDDDDSDDLLDDNEHDNEGVKPDHLIGLLRARHIRSSISDITENPDSHAASRRISIISEN